MVQIEYGNTSIKIRGLKYVARGPNVARQVSLFGPHSSQKNDNYYNDFY